MNTTLDHLESSLGQNYSPDLLAKKGNSRIPSMVTVTDPIKQINKLIKLHTDPNQELNKSRLNPDEIPMSKLNQKKFCIELEQNKFEQFERSSMRESIDEIASKN
ncbi:hypothetical protein BpHYR1_003947 [Brachionus plicatilis]|uniref:Uncharacterized protein n=1 Tax=Brachionus plicatilis TaxID=10195 RepID=A0A3M7S7Z6_BRAPC|nr:hypothetical protein BpHYR1_003947 [Brachionus plicatilis]